MTELVRKLRILLASLSSPMVLRSVFVFVVVFVGLFALHSTAYAEGDGCNLFDGGDLGKCLVNIGGKVIASIFLLFLQFFNVILGWVGGLFNWVMLTTVFQFSYYFANSEGMLLAWGILRDFANILLLFGFLYIGIQTILQINNFSVGKALPTLIIFAVLLNFSLFIAEAMVDVSNAIGSTFYNQAASVDCRNPQNAEECENKGIAAHIFAAAGVTDLMTEDSDGLKRIRESNNGLLALVVVGGALALVIATIGVLAAGAIIFISRAITLMFLLVTSPVGLAGMAVPQLQKWSDKWWDAFIQNIIFAPVFVLLILISLKILDGVRGSFIGPDEDLLTTLSGTGGNPGALLIFFTLVVG
ncbi:hypothetical protein L0Y34_01955, partial [Candidatus Parcubacteria bacterium]|nr:hypothetical protein [Candidatus Parcubacteria bacterium]